MEVDPAILAIFSRGKPRLDVFLTAQELALLVVSMSRIHGASSLITSCISSSSGLTPSPRIAGAWA